LKSSCIRLAFFQLFGLGLTHVSLLESKSVFEIVAQLAGTAKSKITSSHLQTMIDKEDAL
jgi:hypothetical protein